MKDDLNTSRKEYWMKKLSGQLPRITFEYDYKNTDIGKWAMDKICFKVPYESFQRLSQISGGSNYTLHIILTTVVFVQLNKYTGAEDIIIGTPIYMEGRDELTTNVVPIRNNVCSDFTFKELLLNTRNMIIEANENSGYSLDTLLYQLKIPVYDNEFTLFDIMVILNNLQNEDDIESVKTNFNFLFDKKEDSIELTIEFNKNLYSSNTVNRIGANYIELLNNMLLDIDKNVSTMRMLTKEEEKHIIDDFNDNKMDFPKGEMIYDIIEEYAFEHPKKTAIVCQNNSISYSDLNKSVNKVANYLNKCIEVRLEDRIGIIMERSIEVIVAILGIWKAGAAYVPIDPEIPNERIKKILNDAEISMVITQNKFLSDIKKIRKECEHLKNCLCIDSWDNEDEIGALGNGDVKNYSLKDLDEYSDCFDCNYKKVNSDNLAYIIYTSGSTGQPKGAMVEHVGMMNHLYAKINDLNIDENCVVAQNASYCFDISVWQMFVALLAGGKTVIYPNEIVLTPEKLLLDLVNSEVTILEVVPSYLSVILEVAQSNNYRFSKLQYLVVTGETLKAPLVKKWFDIYPSIKIVNAYGPTEASDDITHYIIENEPNIEIIPIGKPISNLNIYIVDHNMNICPIGVRGEICVSGIGVGRGYFNDNLKTEKVFSEDVFKGDGRLYKTGDLGFWMEDGNIGFIGRKDYQVKIRGFRIELGEIESNIINYSNIKEVVVIDKEDNNGKKFLSAYIVPKKKLCMSDLREYLKGKLPEYMIPKNFVEMDKIPLTANGKIDRKALSICTDKDIVKSKDESEMSYIEKKLINVIEEVLEVKGISVDDNFFEIGGDSIAAMQVSSKLQKDKLLLEIKDIFGKSTLRELAFIIKEIENSVAQNEVTGEIKLTPIQKYFFETKEEEQYSSTQVRVILNENSLDVEKIRKTFLKILEHHDALRMRFDVVGKDIVQINRGLDEAFFDLSIVTIEGYSNIEECLEQELNNIIRTKSVTTDNLCELVLFKTKNGDYLAIIIDDLIVDENSWDIILEDFCYIYNQLETNKEIILKKKTHSFKYFSDKLNSYFETQDIKEELGYWENIMGQCKRIDFKNCCSESLIEGVGKTGFELNVEQTKKLLGKVNWVYNTKTKDILITALGLTIKKWTGVNNIVVNINDNGREFMGRYGASDRTVGCFTVQYPVLLDMSKSQDTSYIMKSIKDTLNKVPNNGIGYGLLKYSSDYETKNIDKLKVNPEISLSYSYKLKSYGEENFNLNIKGMNVKEFKKQNLNEKQNINIYVDVINDKVEVSFEFDKIKYSNKVIEELSENYKSNLLYIIEHCINKENREQSPSDFEYDDLTIEDVEGLEEYISDI